jgi:hypothetical protein
MGTHDVAQSSILGGQHATFSEVFEVDARDGGALGWWVGEREREG